MGVAFEIGWRLGFCWFCQSYALGVVLEILGDGLRSDPKQKAHLPLQPVKEHLGP